MMPPFTIDPDQIVRLAGNFDVFVSHLLEAEQAAHGMAGHQLTFNKIVTATDGGVDAGIQDALRTDWLPKGNSAWQFKQNNPAAAACTKELRKATWAHEYLKKGGSYVMVQGRMMEDKQIKARAKALQDEAIRLGLITETERSRIRVYDANQLAKWASEFTALTLDPVLQMSFGPLRDHQRWSDSQQLQDTWVPDANRKELAQEIIQTLNDPNIKQIRIEGPSGIGKTRLAMEAFRGNNLTPLIAYCPDGTALIPDTINYLTTKNRKAVLVIDNCDRTRHDNIAGQIPVGSSLWLVTIGHTSDHPMSIRIFAPKPMSPADIEKLLKSNRPTLWAEARLFVSQNCGGSIRLAYVLADRLEEKGVAQAAELMKRGEIEDILSIVIPAEGQDFLLMAMLALFDRLGWEGELEDELQILADFCGTSVADLRRVGLVLDEQGLLERYGRYRAISPDPVAVYLAAKAWDLDGQRIVDVLLPKLTTSMMRAFFARVADLGRYEPASKLLEELLSEQGLFGSLQSIQDHGVSEFLVQLAIVAPNRTLAHITKLVEDASLDELRAYKAIRHDLVRALEKLAWHTTTFRDAAQALLRLALAENETYANNATGSWASLFGMVLPATAAQPVDRIDYLLGTAASEDPEVLKLVVKACAAGLSGQETVIASAELQEGASVEPRGSIRTYADAEEYSGKLIGVLTTLANNGDTSVAEAAFEELTNHLHPTSLDGYAGKQYLQAIADLGKKFNKQMRGKIAEAKVWATHANRNEFVETLDGLLQQLPPLSDMEQLESLGAISPWEYNAEFLQKQLDDTVRKIIKQDSTKSIVGWLTNQEVNSAWMVGEAIAKATNASSEKLGELTSVVSKNLNALSGFLNASSQLGNPGAFDDFIDSSSGTALEPKMRLFLTMRGPTSTKAEARAVLLSQSMQPKEAGRFLMGWGHGFKPESVVTLLEEWQTAIKDQADYDVTIDWLAFWMHGRDSMPELVRPAVWRVLRQRTGFPKMGQEGWDWSLLARFFLDEKAANIAKLLLKMVEKNDLPISHREESKLLYECIGKDPEGVWAALVPYLGVKSWRMQSTLQGWLVHKFPIDTVNAWMGVSIERGRQVAEFTDPGDEYPTELGKLLLERFPGDTEISGSLNVGYWRDGWSGSWASHIKQQIDQLQNWIDSEGKASPVSKWAEAMIKNLQETLKRAAQDEEERRW